MYEMQRHVVRLPELALPLPRLDGLNLERDALMLRHEFSSPEDAVSQLRQRHPAANSPYFRRYYLKPKMRGGRSTGQTAIMYVWDMDNPKSDNLVATLGTKALVSLPETKFKIAEHAARCLMTGIAWHLCEDRDGEDPLDMGRFDVWDLLRDCDARQLGALGITDLNKLVLGSWDFDSVFFDRVCPGCGTTVSVNDMAYDIDSAQCAKCGVRPFLSRAVARTMKLLIPSSTGSKRPHDAMIEVDRGLLGLVSWMGNVRAGVIHLHRENLPKEWDPHAVLKHLVRNSLTMGNDPAGKDGTAIQPVLLERLRGTISGDLVTTAMGASSALAKAVARGGPFTAVETQAAKLLEAMLQETSAARSTPADT